MKEKLTQVQVAEDGVLALGLMDDTIKKVLSLRKETTETSAPKLAKQEASIASLQTPCRLRYTLLMYHCNSAPKMAARAAAAASASAASPPPGESASSAGAGAGGIDLNNTAGDSFATTTAAGAAAQPTASPGSYLNLAGGSARR